MKILLATDGSKYAREATAQCGLLVRGGKETTVRIITVADYTVDAASEPFMSSVEFVNAVKDEMKKRSEQTLAEAEEIVGYQNENVKIEKQMCVGSAKKLIVYEAEEWGADLIIIGSHGYGFWARALLGSVSNSVVRHAPCSVLVVRKKSEEGSQVIGV